jgi:hypothetical protein
MELEFRRFDMKSITFHNNGKSQGPVIVMIGKRDTGKSLLVRDLLFHHKHIPVGTVISGTEIGNRFYADIVPRLFIHHAYSPSIIEKTLRRQLIAVKQMHAENRFDPRAFLILDDCLYDDKWTRDKLMRLVFMNGRHWKILLIITMQHPMGMPPVLRTNIDYTFILRENVTGNRERIYKHYATAFSSYETFCQVLDKCTENYECLVIKNGGQSNKLQDQIFWYKAEIHPQFKMGSKELWEKSQTLTDDESIIFEDMLKKKKEEITIKKTKW